MAQLFGGGDPSGYSGLTPDQQNMLNQQGWYPNADMVLPNGAALQQPQGYSNLTPAQAATVNNLGYYTNQDAAKPEGSMLQDLIKKLGSPAAKDALQGLTNAMGQQPQRMAVPPTTGQLPSGLLNPYYERQIHAPPQPREALQRLLRGY